MLPAVTLATYEIALYLRLFHSSLAAEERQDYVRTAYAKGQSRTKVIVRHMLPNALLPLITIAGINLGLLLGGTVVTETVFSWPGVGRLIVQSVSQRDYPVIIAGVFVVCLIFVVDQSRRRSAVCLARSAREAVMRRRMTFTAWLALVLLGCVFLLVAVVPLLPGYDPYTQDLGRSLLPPFERLDDGRLSIFGTDKLGRDVLSRIALAGRVSLFIGAFRRGHEHGDRHGAGPRSPAISAAGSRPPSWVSPTCSFPFRACCC